MCAYAAVGVCTVLSFKVVEMQKLSSSHRLLLEWMESQTKRVNCRKKEQKHSGSLRCCTYLCRYPAMALQSSFSERLYD